MQGSGGWRGRLSEALVVVLAVALVGRFVWELLAPAFPLLVVLAALLGMYRLVLGRRDRW